jgi:hypothetical protein
MDADTALDLLLDTLLPGGEGFPSAGSTGMAPVLAARLRQADATLPGRLVAALGAQPGVPGDAAACREAASRLEALEPDLFGEIRKYAYLTYYEQAAVIAAIRALGFRYNESPLPQGYPDEPFAAARDAPRHERGRWIATDAVRRVELSGLGLEETR